MRVRSQICLNRIVLTRITNIMKSTEDHSSKTAGLVKAKSSAADGLRELFIDELKDIIYAERALVKALPKMANNASESKLIAAIDEHVVVTEGQVQRLEKILSCLANQTVEKNAMQWKVLLKRGKVL